MLTIKAEKREEKGRATEALRAEGRVPGVVYGFDISPISIVVDRNELNKLYVEAGRSMVLDLEVEGSKNEVLIQDLQRDALTDFLIHVDFRKIDMNKKVTTLIPVTVFGESVAVKELGGTLIQALDAVEVKALPNALVREIKVDAAQLTTFDKVIRVSDLTVPDGVEILTDGNRSIALVQPPRTEAEMEALDETVDTSVEEVEVSSEKKEGEEAENEQAAESSTDKKTEEKKEDDKKED